MMPDTTKRKAASIDHVIVWLQQQRSSASTVSLSELLDNCTLLKDEELNDAQLIDLACVDLILRRRLGQPATADEYLRDFNSLRHDRYRLDLIDAEICVSNELAQSLDVDEYVARFPELADSIRELFSLDCQPHRSEQHDVSVQSVNGSQQPSVEVEASSRSFSEFEDSLAFSIDSKTTTKPAFAAEADVPIDIPDSFHSGQCVARRPGQWLLRGRDADRGIPLAMKIITLPTLTRGREAEQLLDACERAAKVPHHSWIVPYTAMVQRRHLAVVRPWLFSRSWPEFQTNADAVAQVRALATVAFAVQSAHQVKACHGALHAGNLLVGQDKEVQVVDGGISSLGISRDLAGNRDATRTLDETFAERRDRDLRDFVKLVAATELEWVTSPDESVVGLFHQLILNDPENALANMGNELIAVADQRQGLEVRQRDSGRKSSWQKLRQLWNTK